MSLENEEMDKKYQVLLSDLDKMQNECSDLEYKIRKVKERVDELKKAIDEKKTEIDERLNQDIFKIKSAVKP